VYGQMGYVVMDWIELDEGTNRWREILSAVMNIRIT